MTRDLRRALEAGTLDAAAALEELKPIAQGANVRAVRVEAYGLIGEIAGRAFDATWEVAERAAWVLLNVARHAEVLAEKRGLLFAMGRGFRNLWLMPFVHARLNDPRPDIVEAAITASGGLGFAALEEVVATRFLAAEVAPQLRRAAIDALGRMGAISSASRLVGLIDGDDAVAALTALTEMRSPVGTAETAALIEREPPRDVMVAAVRYLGEMGSMALPPLLRRLGRNDDPELRALASLCARAFKAERERDAGDRILIALGEKDRAVRALLARRLRTLPIAEVLEQADMLLGDYPEGVVQILGELRDPEVTHFLLKVSARTNLPEQVASRAIGAIVADEKWEREALLKVIAESKDERVRAAAAQAMGSFATLDEVLEQMGSLGSDPSPLLRGALVWAMQLAARPATLEKAVEKRCEDELRRGLKDEDVVVRRRSAYVSGNLRLARLAPDLIELAKREEKRADLRVAAYSGLSELAAAPVLNELVTLFRREEDPAALVAVSRAVVATAERNPDAQIDFARLQGRIVHLLGAADPAVREAGVSLAGLSRGAVPASALLPLAAANKDAGAPHVREAALLALGRIGGTEAEPVLVKALEDPDSAIQELAAEALLSLGGRRPLEQLLAYVSGEEDGAVRAGIAARLTIPDVEAAHFRPLVNAAIERLEPSDRAYEPLVALKIKLLEQQAGGSAPASGATFDAAIIAVFPTYAKLSTVRGFEPLNRSLRTAESLYRSSGQLAEADHSSPIMLWMKCLEGYVHAWLAPRLTLLQRQPAELFSKVDQILIDAWPTYQSYLQKSWRDSVEVGGTRVEVPLRSTTNALRDFQDRRMRRLESPLSVTDWARMMLFFAVDHASGVSNLFKVSSKNPDQVVRVVHKLMTLAGVRNVVTHRAAAGASTLEAFRRDYYATFQDVTSLA